MDPSSLALSARCEGSRGQQFVYQGLTITQAILSSRILKITNVKYTVNQRLLVSANTRLHVCDLTMSRRKHPSPCDITLIAIQCDSLCANCRFLKTSLAEHIGVLQTPIMIVFVYHVSLDGENDCIDFFTFVPKHH